MTLVFLSSCGGGTPLKKPNLTVASSSEKPNVEQSAPRTIGATDPSYFDYSDFAIVVPNNNAGVPDSVLVVFGTPLPDANYTVVYGGYKQEEIPDDQMQNFYNIEVEGKTRINTKTQNGFTIDFTWTAYNSATNTFAGSWDRFNAMVAALNLPPGVIEVLTIDWRLLKTQ